MASKKEVRAMVARWLTAASLLFLFTVSLASSKALASEGSVKPVSGDESSGTTVLDPASVEQLSLEDARRLIASAGEVLSLPRLSDLSWEAAHELATNRDPSHTCTYKVCVPVATEKTVTYEVMVPCAEEKTREDGTKVSITKCRPETRTRTYMVTVCVPEERSHVCPLTLQLDGLVSPTTQALAELAKHDGNLHLNGMKSLTRGGAQKLSAHQGGSLFLNGIDSLESGVAEALASHAGDMFLNGIRTVSASTAKALCKSKHRVSLNGLTVLTDEIAAELAAHEGSVSLQGVTQASEKAIQMLRGRPVVIPQALLSEQKKEKESTP